MTGREGFAQGPEFGLLAEPPCGYLRNLSMRYSALLLYLPGCPG